MDEDLNNELCPNSAEVHMVLPSPHTHTGTWEATKRVPRSTDTPWVCLHRCSFSSHKQILCQYISSHLWEHSCFLMSEAQKTAMISWASIIFSSQRLGTNRLLKSQGKTENMMACSKLGDFLPIRTLLDNVSGASRDCTALFTTFTSVWDI